MRQASSLLMHFLVRAMLCTLPPVSSLTFLLLFFCFFVIYLFKLLVIPGIPMFSQQSLVLVGALAGIILVLAVALACIGHKYRAISRDVEIVTYDPIQ
jgi:hypothetical protein